MLLWRVHGGARSGARLVIFSKSRFLRFSHRGPWVCCARASSICFSCALMRTLRLAFSRLSHVSMPSRSPCGDRRISASCSRCVGNASERKRGRRALRSGACVRCGTCTVTLEHSSNVGTKYLQQQQGDPAAHRWSATADHPAPALELDVHPPPARAPMPAWHRWAAPPPRGLSTCSTHHHRPQLRRRQAALAHYPGH